MSSPATMIEPLSARDLAGDQAQQRGLAGAARPHDRGDPAARDVHVEAAEDRAAADRVSPDYEFQRWGRLDSMMC